MENTGLDIDASRLSVADLAELRDLFELQAKSYRDVNRPAMADFIISVAGMVHTAAQQVSAATNEPLPAGGFERVEPDSIGVDLGKLDKVQAITAANTLYRIAEGFEKQSATDKRFGPLADVFLGISEVFGRRTQALVDADKAHGRENGFVQ